MTKQQEKLIHKVKWIALCVALAVLLLATAVVLMKEENPEVTIGLVPNPYNPEDFVMQDGYMTCLAAETWLGVDVSHHQGDIRWDEVADAGVRFAMIRVAHRAVSDGQLRMDRNWEQNLQGVQDAGLQVGVYFYSQAISAEEAREEACFLLEALDGVKLDFPVVFDWEIFSATSRNANVPAETVNACAIAFCEEVAKAGYDPMVYTNLDLANRIWDLETLEQKGYPVWLALYRNHMNWEYLPAMWQYTESGSVPGIGVPVDLNLYFPPKE
jgi:GH25 family lysozyme M1 (1,4-beta-N-acetylmuramidase)